ncbi:MAG: TadE/TadG family type IV pilus assembly protein [Anaerolineales bacterium]
MVEFALITPLLLIIILVIVEFALVVFQYNTVANVARQGARQGVVAFGTNAQIAAAAEAGAEDAAAALGLAEDRLQVDATVTGTDSKRVAVKVEYEVQLLTAPVIQALGGGKSGSFTLTATSSMIHE